MTSLRRPATVTQVRGLAAVSATVIGALAYIFWTESRIWGLQVEENLAYDVSSCCEIEKTKSELSQCFRDLSYSMGRVGPQVDVVMPGATLPPGSYSGYYAEIHYNSANNIDKWFLKRGTVTFAH